MLNFIKILAFILVDFICIWLWIYRIDPDPSASITIFVFIPIIVIINLVLAGIFYFIKKKVLFKLFIINAALSSFIFYFLFQEGIARHQHNRLESWQFTKHDTVFHLIRWKETNEFSMSYSLDPASSWSFLDGKYLKENDEWILTADSIEMKIKENKLIGFRASKDTIQMMKVKR